jgi:hypothetical protein
MNSLFPREFIEWSVGVLSGYASAGAFIAHVNARLLRRTIVEAL